MVDGGDVTKEPAACHTSRCGPCEHRSTYLDLVISNIGGVCGFVHARSRFVRVGRREDIGVEWSIARLGRLAWRARWHS